MLKYILVSYFIRLFVPNLYFKLPHLHNISSDSYWASVCVATLHRLDYAHTGQTIKDT